MESRNIEKALEISAKLAAGETVSEQGTNSAYVALMVSV